MVLELVNDQALVGHKKRGLAKMVLWSFDIHGQLVGHDPMNISMHLWSISILINRLLHASGDGMEMRLSAEGRGSF